jgi:sortase (surface protein transpeptidase)
VAHTVTRIVFTRARVNLPVITATTNESFPYCDVAERMSYYSEPGAGGVVYLYAHATHYMFGGLLAASWQPDSYLMGQQIQIYTSDNLVYTYAVTEIHRHVPYNSFDVANDMVGDALLLQACENNDATGPKLLVVGRPVSVTAASYANAHPLTAPRVCAHGY